jgi:hypothetical protein
LSSRVSRGCWCRWQSGRRRGRWERCWRSGWGWGCRGKGWGSCRWGSGGWGSVWCGRQCGVVRSGITSRRSGGRKVRRGARGRCFGRWWGSRVICGIIGDRFTCGRGRGGMRGGCACCRQECWFLCGCGRHSGGCWGAWFPWSTALDTNIQICPRSRVHLLSWRWITDRICRFAIERPCPILVHRRVIVHTRAQLPLSIRSQIRVFATLWC